MSRWYIIHAYSGFENKVRDAINAEATRLGLSQLVEQVEVPTEKITSDRKFFPGYVLAKLSMNDDVYHLVKNTPKVTGFLGSMGKPQPISDAEAARILNTKDEAAAAAPKQKISVDYEIGDQVKVLDGPFASFNGVVEELDFDRGRVKVSVSIFGRATPVELEFEQVERVK
jgi:transcriptional antiterminator NusG